ncbi:hypothetical protein D3C73_1585520 [compost metagenome]
MMSSCPSPEISAKISWQNGADTLPGADRGRQSLARRELVSTMYAHQDLGTSWPSG